MTSPPDLDPVADCTCPTKYDDAQRIVRAGTDQRCAVHGIKGQANCPTCGNPIVQTPAVARQMVEKENNDG